MTTNPHFRAISNGQARRIASEWHGGQFTALYALASSGAITDVDALRTEIAEEAMGLPTGIARRELLALDRYVREVGERAPLTSTWPLVWDDAPAELENV